MPESVNISSRTKLFATGLVAFLLLYLLFAANSSSSRSESTSYGYPPPPKPSSILPPEHVTVQPLPSRPPPDQATLQSSLRQTLRAILDRAIPSHADSLLKQSQLCPNLKNQTATTQIREDYEWWETVSEAELRAGRDAVVLEVAAQLGVSDVGGEENPELDPKAWDGLFGDGRRGIVYAGGNGNTAKRILNSLTILRKQGCMLPAEIWAFASELKRLDGRVRRQLEALGGVSFRTSGSSLEGSGKHYEIKGEAIAHSSFSEFLFDSPLYQQHGMVLWPDYGKDSSANPIWRMTGKDCDPDEFTAETGQVLVNKRAQGGVVLAALLVAEAMQKERKFWYRLSQGDKDTFRYAFYLLDAPYSPAPHYLAAAGSPLTDGYKEHVNCGHTMLQFGLSPTEWELPDVRKLVDADFTPPRDHAPPLFVHANLLKHSGGLNGWFAKNPFTYHRGNTFQTVKHVTPDLLQNSTSKVMDRIRFIVYNHRGLCVDIWEEGAASGEVAQAVTTERWEDAWGGMLRGFEDLFYDNGGITA
ncbi:hypothetical protein RQP46_006362 [Phenoliferia psychrophenolica]